MTSLIDHSRRLGPECLRRRRHGNATRVTCLAQGSWFHGPRLLFYPGCIRSPFFTTVIVGPGRMKGRRQPPCMRPHARWAGEAGGLKCISR